MPIKFEILSIRFQLCISILGDPREESELLTWLLYQMKEDTIENINRDLMIKMIAQYEFLGVFFCKWII